MGGPETQAASSAILFRSSRRIANRWVSPAPGSPMSPEGASVSASRYARLISSHSSWGNSRFARVSGLGGSSPKRWLAATWSV